MPRRRSFEIHENVFYLLVARQAGTIESAILESVMNSVDAGSPNVEVEITEKRIRILDQGKGFVNDDEVERYFKTIGTPHKEGDAYYGKFRMGRCKGFYYGVNTWRSNTYKFVVDVKTRGREHDVHRNLPQHPGCEITIDLYTALDRSQLRHLTETLASWVAYCPIPVTVNGKLVSQNPSTATWTMETNEAYIRLDPTAPSMKIYNRGVFVTELSVAELGSGGCVVTKPPIDVVYARNQVQAKCPIWRAIQKTIKKHTMAQTKRVGMTAPQRAFFANELLAGSMELSAAYEAGLRLVTLMDRRHVSLEEFARLVARGVGSADDEDRIARSIHDNRLACVVTQSTVTRFGANSLKELIETVKRIHEQAYQASTLQRARDGVTSITTVENRIRAAIQDLARARIVDLAPLAALTSSNIVPIKPSLLPAEIRSYVAALRAGMKHIPGIDDIRAAYSEDIAITRSGDILLVNPVLMPDLSGGLPALLQTAALALDASTQQPNEDDDEPFDENLARYTAISRTPFVANWIMAHITTAAKRSDDTGALRTRAVLADFIALGQAALKG